MKRKIKAKYGYFVIDYIEESAHYYNGHYVFTYSPNSKEWYFCKYDDGGDNIHFNLTHKLINSELVSIVSQLDKDLETLCFSNRGVGIIEDDVICPDCDNSDGVQYDIDNIDDYIEFYSDQWDFSLFDKQWLKEYYKMFKCVPCLNCVEKITVKDFINIIFNDINLSGKE